MAQDLESLLRDVFGEPLAKLTQFQGDQMKKLTGKLQEVAREALKDDLGKLHTEIGELRARVARLERERMEQATESIEPLV